VLIGIETKAAQNFDQLFGRMNAAGFTYRDITQDEALAEFLI
jgi:threonine dehydratase